MRSKKNPFPGMNPYFQQRWSDVHLILIAYIRDALSAVLPDDMVARGEEHIGIAGQEKPGGYRADVALVEEWRSGLPPVWTPDIASTGAVAVTEPLIYMDEPETERWIEIREAGGRLVTVIEVLSPVNKREDGWLAYRGKQRNLLAGGVNLVEIDLIRGGAHAVAIRLDQLTLPPGTCHLVCVARATSPGRRQREVYRCPLRQPLPTIRVPLRATDPDVPLALQPLIDRIYETGRYWLENHTRLPAPPVAEEDEAWVDGLVLAAGLR